MPNFINLPAFTEDGDVRVVIDAARQPSKAGLRSEIGNIHTVKITLRRTELSA
jgi:hypothetical protein